MIDVEKIMKDTDKLRTRMWQLWDNVQSGKAKGPEVRDQISIANSILTGHKVDIAAANYIGSTPLMPPPQQIRQRKTTQRRITS